MTLPTDARGTVLSALDAVLRAYQHDPERCGLEALRSLRAAGMTWHDLFGPVVAAEPCVRKGGTLAEARAICAAEIARGVLAVVFTATPMQLATMAVALCRPDGADSEMERASDMLLHLYHQEIKEMRPRSATLIVEEL